MTPEFLQKGDRIHIVSPSGAIQSELIDGAKSTLEKLGFNVTIGKNAKNEFGRYGGTETERISDLQEALDNSNIKGILCSRGGYGVSQIIDKLDFSAFCSQPKWLLGFSDITVLHSAINNKEIASLHSIMAKHLTELSPASDQTSMLLDILSGNFPTYKINAEELNRNGKATGKIIGGNLSVMAGLRGTPFEPEYENNILFIEDIGEKPYHIDRMMQNLRLGGVLKKISGLIVGQFSDCDEDPLMGKTIQEIIASSVEDYNYPVCFNFPAGHVEYNLPLILGLNATLEVSSKQVILHY